MFVSSNTQTMTMIVCCWECDSVHCSAHQKVFVSVCHWYTTNANHKNGILITAVRCTFPWYNSIKMCTSAIVMICMRRTATTATAMHGISIKYSVVKRWMRWVEVCVRNVLHRPRISTAFPHSNSFHFYFMIANGHQQLLYHRRCVRKYVLNGATRSKWASVHCTLRPTYFMTEHSVVLVKFLPFFFVCCSSVAWLFILQMNLIWK